MFNGAGTSLGCFVCFLYIHMLKPPWSACVCVLEQSSNSYLRTQKYNCYSNEVRYQWAKECQHVPRLGHLKG